MSVILVVDDDAPTREALATGLKKSGHEIYLAGTGAAAWRKSGVTRWIWPSST